MQIAANGSNINPIAIAMLQAKNADGSYFIPSSWNGRRFPERRGVQHSRI